MLSPSIQKVLSHDVTFNEQEAYFTQPYLQGENPREDKEMDLRLPDLPNFLVASEPESNTLVSPPVFEVDPASNEATIPIETEPEPNGRFGKVYTKRSKVIPESIQVQLFSFK